MLFRLLSKIGRTKIESKSQLLLALAAIFLGCYQRSEEQRLKANHNYERKYNQFLYVVIKDRKNKD